LDSISEAKELKPNQQNQNRLKRQDPWPKNPKAEKPKAELYTMKEDIVYQNKQYPKGTMDLANVPANIRDGWLLDKKMEPYVGEQKEVQKELKDKPGRYTTKTDFHYPTQDDLYINGNVENLTNVPASILADWKKNGWVEPYKGPVE
jgi:hypothetical protein